MADFDITGPDGTKYRVSGETAQGAYAALQKHISSQKSVGDTGGFSEAMAQTTAMPGGPGAAAPKAMPTPSGIELPAEDTSPASAIAAAMGVPVAGHDPRPSVDKRTPPSPPPTPREQDPIPFGMMGGSSDDQVMWARREIARQMAETGEKPVRPDEAALIAAVSRPQKDDVVQQDYTPTGQAILSELGNTPERLARGFKGNRLMSDELGIHTSETIIENTNNVQKRLETVREEIAAKRSAYEAATAPQDRHILEQELNALVLTERRLAEAVEDPEWAAEVRASAEKSAKGYEADRVVTKGQIDDLTDAMTPTRPKPGLSEALVSGIASFGDMAPGVAATIVTRNPLPMMAYLGYYSRGSTYADKRAQGVDPQKAATAANLYALAEAIPEIAPLHVILKGGRGPLAKIIGGAVTEGASEVMTQGLQQLVDIGVLNRDMTWGEAIGEMKKAGAAGAVMGGLMGAGATVADKVSPSRPSGDDGDKPAKSSPFNPVTPVQPKPDQSPEDPLVAAMSPDVPVAQEAPRPLPAPVDVSETQVFERQTPLTSAEAPQTKIEKPEKGASDQAEKTNMPEAAPEDGGFEVMDETETVDGETRLTGRKVRVNLDTGEAEVVNEGTGVSADTTGKPGPVGGAGSQPQASVEDVSGNSASPAADQPAAPKVDPKGRKAPQRVFLTHDQTMGITTDPKTFQYKGDADAEGINDRLRGVTRFDPNRAGQAVLFQRRDGTLVVADGHQRTGLARRMADAGQKDVSGMAAVIYREADGYTPQEVMTEAAIKNIGEGSGTAVDAARILRNSKETVADLGLPPNSAMVRTADGLRRLSDQAFGMVANGVASERDGAAVGKNVTDSGLHSDVLALLTKLKPENEAQAAMIARDAASSATTETQDSLFGPEQVQQSLYGERAKVLDHAIKSLGKSISTFRTLIDRAEAITSAGNQLAKKENAARLDDDTRVRQYLTSQANMKGEISDALTEAARLVRSGTPVRVAATDFVRNVQRRMEGGGRQSEGAPRGGSGTAPPVETSPVARPAPEADTSPDGDLLAAMTPTEEPGAEGLPQTVIPGAEGSDDQAKAADEVKRKAEAEAKAQQSKIRRDGQTRVEDEEGNLFGGPKRDLFDEPAKPSPTDPVADEAQAKKARRDALLARRAETLASYRREGDDAVDLKHGSDDLTGQPEGLDLLDALAAADTLPKKRKAAESWVLKRGHETGVEHLVTLDFDGVPLSIRRGHKSGVSPEAAVWRAGVDGKVWVSVHNHPSSRGLSGSDYAILAIWPKHTMIVMAHNGDRHEVSATEAFDRADEMARKDAIAAFGPLNEVLSETLNSSSWAINKHLLDLGQADGDGHDRFIRATRPFNQLIMDELGLIVYADKAKWLKAFEAAGFDFGEFYGQVSGPISDRLRRAGFVLPESGDRGGNPKAGSSRPASPPGTDRAGRKPAPDGERGDRGGRVPPPDEVAPDDFDAALDAVFGATPAEPKVNPSGDRTYAAWASAVPSPGRENGWTIFDDTEIGGAFVLKTRDLDVRPFKSEADARAWAKKNAPASVRKAEAAPDGSESDQGGRVPDSTPVAPDDFDSALDDVFGKQEPAPRSSADIAKDLGALFSEPNGSGFRESDAVDQAKYARAVPLFTEALTGHDVAAMPRKDAFVAMIRPLVAAGLKREAVASMRPYFERFLDDVASGRIDLNGGDHVSGPSSDLERDSGDATPEDGMGPTGVSASGGGNGSGSGTRGGAPDSGRGRSGGKRLPGGDAAPLGTDGDPALQGGGRSGQQSADGGDGSAGGDAGQQGLPPDESPTDLTRTVARNRADLKDRAKAQAEADATAKRNGVRPADEQNIRDTLPLLLPEQQDDVLKVERRFAKPDGHGMMITNGTGTGKTYSGGGVIKRFVQSGRDNILILAPSQGILDHWVEAGADLGLTISKLDDTTSAGRGIVATTYANAGMNGELAKRNWDLVVTDEAHKLSQNATGDATSALRTVRAITNRPADLRAKSQMLHAGEWDKARAMKDGEAKTAEMHRLHQQEDAEVKALAKEPRSKVLFLSATPFAYDQNVDYADGYLFDYPEDGHVGRSRQSGRNLFMVEHFGYRIRYHRLTKPEAAVDSGVFEREFHEKLKREGALTGRHLNIEPDYDRRFIATDDAQGAQIDGIIDFIREKSHSPDKAEADAYMALWRAVQKRFNYLKRMQLLEAIKARAAQADINKHLAMGRKIVIFHDYNIGGGFNPFRPMDDINADAAMLAPDSEAGQDAIFGEEAQEGYDRLAAARPEVETLNFAGYLPPVNELKKVYGDRAVIYNGTIPQKDRAKAKKDFNTDGSGTDIMIVQSAAGEAGISLHDVTGAHQRVLINLGMPTRPTTALQEEGRIRREGSVTDALFHYYTIGTTWERQAFAKKIAERSGTVENLALGAEARTIRESFIEAYEEAQTYEPGEGDGKGGKDRDRARARTTPYDAAKSHYFGRVKTSGKRDQRDGIDFYPTPEPLAFKMIEWAGIRPYERVLEPSAGDGSIARYFPDHADRTIVEPSAELLSKAELRAPGSRTVASTFEKYHIVNKHHVIVMNPPFGQGGKTAIEHLAKAAGHLRPGGRIVALIPTGPAADKRFDAWWDSDESDGLWRSNEITLPAVTFEKAGTTVAARILVIDKVDPVANDLLGSTRHVNLTGANTIGEFFDRLEGIGVQGRQAQAVNAADELLNEQEEAASPPADPVAGGRGASQPSAPLPDQAFKSAETTHAKTGEALFVATATERVSSEAYRATLAVAKRHNGWYSSFRGRGAIPGYQFKSEADRTAFLDDMKKPTVGFEEASDTGFIRHTDELGVPDDGPLSRELLRRYMPQLRAELDRLDLKRVRLSLDDTGASWQGMFLNSGAGGMDVIIGASMDPMRTLHHEVIHILRAMNLFTPEEWRALEIKAERDWVAKYDIEARYPTLLPSERVEEAIAEAFADAMATKTAPNGSLLVNAFNKIARLMRAIRNVFNGAGFQTAEDVFGRIGGGQMTKRDRDATWTPDLAFAQKSQALPKHIVKWVGQVSDLFSKMVPPPKLPPTLELGPIPAIIRSLPKTGKVRVLGDSLVMSTGKAKSVMADHKEVDKGAWARLPRLISEPEMILLDTDPDHAATIKIVTGEMAGKSQIVVMVNTEGTAHGNRPANAVVTFYAPTDFKSMMDRAVRNQHEVLYVKAERKGDGYERIGTSTRRASSVDDTISRLRADPKILTPGQIIKAGKPSSGFREDGPKFQAARIPSRQARAHMATAMQGAAYIPDRRVWEELSRAGAPVWERLHEGAGATRDRIDRVRIKIQDRFLPVLRAQQAIERATGSSLTDDQNAYLKETTFSGKVGRHLFEIDEDFTKPIIDLIAETKGDMTADDVGAWLYARHAVERNQRIASINPAMPDGGSGMMTADAQGLLAAAAAGPHAARLMQIGALIDGLRERTLKLREDKGLITHAEAHLWRTQYKHYVPLKGFADTDLSEAVLDLFGAGRRFNTRGPESRRALGRNSEAFNPLQAAITQAQEVSIRAEKNAVGQAAYELAKDFPSPALWSVKKVKMKRFYNRTTGLVESRPEDPVSLFMEPNEMAVKVGGEEHRIIFHDPRLARALGTVGADQMGWFIKAMSVVGRWFSMARTMLNPEFVLTNAFRDMSAAQINIGAFADADRHAIRLAMVRDWRKALVGAYRGAGNKADTEWTRYYREFEKAGGKVSFWTLEQPEAGQADLNRRIWLASGPRAARIAKTIISPSAFFSTRDNGVLHAIERINIAVDNAIRLSAFVAARKRGWSEAQAASLAKNLTVNFNRRGEGGATANALYVFFNASVQGSVTMLKAMRSKKVAMIALGLIAAGFLNDMSNAYLSDEDDDGVLFYDKIPDYESQSSFQFMLGKDSETAGAIPMPYGWRIFPYLGQQIGKIRRGVKEPDAVMADFAVALMGSFSPVNGSDIYSFLMPTVGDPALEIATNRDWRGRPIMPDYDHDLRPDSQKYWAGASEGSKLVADAVNRATGGSTGRSGMVDVSPENIDHLFGFAVGSAGQFWGRSVDLVAKAASGKMEDVTWNDVPFARTVVTETGDWLDRDRYFAFRDQIDRAVFEVKTARKTGEDVSETTRQWASLANTLKEAEKRRKDGQDIYLKFNARVTKTIGVIGE